MKQLALIAAFLAAGPIAAAVVPGFAQSSASSMLDASSMLSSSSAM